MANKDGIYKDFLAELEAMEKFRMGYAADHPNAPLRREDQDVRRLIEAMAFFSARTKAAGQRAIARSTRRLFQQHFPYILTPLPAHMMVQAKPDARFVETTSFDQGAFFVAESATEKTTHRVRTLQPLRLLPITLEDVRIDVSGTRSTRLLLSFESAFQRNDAIGTVKLYINHLNELLSSLAVHYHLKQSVRGASVFFGAIPPDFSGALPCQIQFAPTKTPEVEIGPLMHPLQMLRSRLFYPQQDLYVELQVSGAPRNWQRFTVALELDATWPTQMRVSRDTFHLHVVPAANFFRDTASPMEWDGTRERVPVLPSDPENGAAVQSLLGVYEKGAEGMQRLRSAALTGGTGTYELEFEQSGGQRRTWLSLEAPDAFTDPIPLVVEAFWHQPGHRVPTSGDVQIRPTERHVEGLQWQMQGQAAPSLLNPLEDDHEALLQLLSVKNQRFLALEDLRFLLNALGAIQLEEFKMLLAEISDLKVTPKPFASKTTGFKYVYELSYEELDPYLMPALDYFSTMLIDLFSIWSAEDIIDLTVEIKNLNRKLIFNPRRSPS